MVSGTEISLSYVEPVNYVITIVWVVGIMNSLNMLDNMDAITSTVSISSFIRHDGHDLPSGSWKCLFHGADRRNGCSHRIPLFQFGTLPRCTWAIQGSQFLVFSGRHRHQVFMERRTAFRRPYLGPESAITLDRLHHADHRYHDGRHQSSWPRKITVYRRQRSYDTCIGLSGTHTDRQVALVFWGMTLISLLLVVIIERFPARLDAFVYDLVFRVPDRHVFRILYATRTVVRNIS